MNLHAEIMGLQADVPDDLTKSASYADTALWSRGFKDATRAAAACANSADATNELLRDALKRSMDAMVLLAALAGSKMNESVPWARIAEDARKLLTGDRPAGLEASSRSYFGFRDAKSGDLVRMYEDNESYRLSLQDEDPVFRVQDQDDLARTLFENTPGYNSSAECPGWGCMKAGEMIPVRVTETTISQSIELVQPLRVKTVEVRSIPRNTATKYAGVELPDGGDFVFWLVNLPDGESVESVQRWEGTKVHVDKYMSRHLFKAVAVPEEYVSLLNGQAGALFIASERLP